jgi:hypothetical protein
MVAKKKATKKTTKKSVKPKTKVVYKTRTVYRKAPKEEVSPLGGVVRDTSAMVGLGVGAIIGIGVAKSIGNALNN